MSIKGDFNIYIYIPVKYNENIKKKSEYCFNVLLKLIEKQHFLNRYTLHEQFDNQSNKSNKEDILKHIYYNTANLNITKDKEKNEKKYVENQPHITIADSVQIKKHMISSFVNKIKEKLKNQNCFYLFFKKSVDLYRNQKNTKYFCSYTVSYEQQELHLNPLIEKINEVLNEFGLKNNHVNRLCHISLAYTDIKLEKILEKNNLNIDATCWPNIDEIINDNNSYMNIDDFYIYIYCIHVCIGNKIYEVHFKTFDDNLNLLESDNSSMSNIE